MADRPAGFRIRVGDMDDVAALLEFWSQAEDRL